MINSKKRENIPHTDPPNRQNKKIAELAKMRLFPLLKTLPVTTLAKWF